MVIPFGGEMGWVFGEVLGAADERKSCEIFSKGQSAKPHSRRATYLQGSNSVALTLRQALVE